jgi:hypothetical protein
VETKTLGHGRPRRGGEGTFVVVEKDESAFGQSPVEMRRVNGYIRRRGAGHDRQKEAARNQNSMNLTQDELQRMHGRKRHEAEHGDESAIGEGQPRHVGDDERSVAS